MYASIATDFPNISCNMCAMTNAKSNPSNNVSISFFHYRSCYEFGLVAALMRDVLVLITVCHGNEQYQSSLPLASVCEPGVRQYDKSDALDVKFLVFKTDVRRRLYVVHDLTPCSSLFVSYRCFSRCYELYRGTYSGA